MEIDNFTISIKSQGSMISPSLFQDSQTPTSPLASWTMMTRSSVIFSTMLSFDTTCSSTLVHRTTSFHKQLQRTLSAPRRTSHTSLSIMIRMTRFIPSIGVVRASLSCSRDLNQERSRSMNTDTNKCMTQISVKCSYSITRR